MMYNDIARIYTAQNERFGIYGIFERKKQFDDIPKVGTDKGEQLSVFDLGDPLYSLFGTKLLDEALYL